MAKKKTTQAKRYTQNNGHGASSKFGQLIGEEFDAQVYALIQQYLKENHPNYILLEPEEGKKIVKLEMLGGTIRQMDNVIVPVNSREPVALFESKWLKDARHHNDKGAWILQLREVRKRYPTIRGAVANLAGYWTEGVAVMFEREGRIRMVLVATDEEVYQTLQPYVDEYCQKHNLEGIQLDATTIRNSLPRSWDLANCLTELHQNGELKSIANEWLHFPRKLNDDGELLIGSDLVKSAIDELLMPVSDNPSIEKFEIALQINTGNTIYKEFTDGEEAVQFIQTYFRNPDAILGQIIPKQNTVEEKDTNTSPPLDE